MDDKRVFYILPTEKALALVESAKTDLNQHLNHLVKEMGKDEFEQLVMLAGKANKILEANRENNNIVFKIINYF